MSTEDIGVTPDGWSFIPEGDLADEPQAVIAERLQRWRPEMTHFRMTDTTGEYANAEVPSGVWIEVWRERPQREPAFDPPLTAAALPTEQPSQSSKL